MRRKVLLTVNYVLSLSLHFRGFLIRIFNVKHFIAYTPHRLMCVQCSHRSIQCIVYTVYTQCSTHISMMLFKKKKMISRHTIRSFSKNDSLALMDSILFYIIQTSLVVEVQIQGFQILFSLFLIIHCLEYTLVR